MKQTMTILFSLACVSGFASGVTAQVPGTPGSQIGGQVGGQMMRDKNMPDEAHVIGCMSQSADMTHFMLNNVKIVDSKTNSPINNAATMKKDDKPKSYMLMSADDLKAHVGHQVELTGAIIANSSGVVQGEVKGQMPHELLAKGAAMSDVPTFAVKSVKMISNACG